MIEQPIMNWGDLFAGGGGTTTGALAVPNVKVLWALNHSREAIYTHEINHPETEHFHADIQDMDEHKLCKVDGLWASLECTNFSNAKGGKSKNEDSRTLAWELNRYIVWCKPKVIAIENVREFLDWGPLDEHNKPIKHLKGTEYKKWISSIIALGYPNYKYKILNSANYGAYTSRRRLFIIFTIDNLDISFPETILHKNNWKPCKEKIDLNNTGNSIFGRKKPLANATLKRIAAGIKKYHPDMAHIMQYYGNGYNGQSLEKPLNTITTKDRHALVHFITEYYGRDNAHSSIENPLNTITTFNRHALTTIEKKQFVTEYNGQSIGVSLDHPMNSLTTKQKHALATIEKKHFVSDHIWGMSNQSIEKPLNTICTKESKQLVTIDESDHNKKEKYQFITKYFSGTPEHQNSSLEEPLHIILGTNHHALASLVMNGSFDIKLRFLTPDELADITGFPKSYKWYGSNKFKVWMIGNAVPVILSKVIIEEIKTSFDSFININ